MDQPDVITVTNFHYTQPGPDAFFWVGTDMINGGCNDDNIGASSFSLAPGEIGSKCLNFLSGCNIGVMGTISKLLSNL